MNSIVLQQESPLQTVVKSIFSPDYFDFWARHIHPTWSWQRPLARIVARQIEGRDSVTLTLKPNRHAKPFLAGQHLNITTEIDGIRATRSYSPTLLPHQKGVFSITIKRIRGGKVSTWFTEYAKVGQVVELGEPFGEMTLSQHQKHLFLAAGSGITPFISLIREWIKQGAHGQATLIYWAKTQAELCFVNEFTKLTNAHKNLNIHYILTQEKLEKQQFSERINQNILETLVTDLEQHAVYACGPSEFVEQARQFTQHTAKDFHGEAFSIPQLDFETTEHVNIQLTKSNRRISIPVGQSILTALEAQGIKPASGCRMGICNTCVCTKQAGTTEHVLTKDRDTETGSSVRICVSSARSDLALDL